MVNFRLLSLSKKYLLITYYLDISKHSAALISPIILKHLLLHMGSSSREVQARMLAHEMSQHRVLSATVGIGINFHCRLKKMNFLRLG